MGAADSSNTGGGAANVAHLLAPPLAEESASLAGLGTASRSVSNLTVEAAPKSGASSSNDLAAIAEGSIATSSPALIRAIELSADIGSVTFESSLASTASNEEEARLMLERVENTVLMDGDSDLEVETEVPSLESLISWEVLKHLKPKEKKRQEVVNEFFHTERTHVRNLKVLYHVFYKPMVIQRVVSTELIKLLFGNLDELLEIHEDTIHKRMKQIKEIWRQDTKLEGLYGDIGELVEGIFDSATIGDRLMRATAQFCMNQQHALDILRW